MFKLRLSKTNKNIRINMKIKKLNMRGIAHYIAPLLFVVIFAIGGTAYLVASHADTPCPPNAVACSDPPSVTILTPAVQSTVSGVVSVTVRIADPAPLEGAPVSMQFQVDSTKLGTPQIVTPPVNGAIYSYSWTSSTVANGSHLIGVSVQPVNQTTKPGILALGGVSTFYPVTVNNINSVPAPPIPTPVPPVSNGSYTLIGKASPTGASETISAYACVTKLTNTEWATTALYELSNSYKQPAGFNWTATVTNTGTTPLPGNQSVSQNFVNDATKPAAILTILSNPQGQNPLTFSYKTTFSGNTTTSGTIAQGVHPVDLVTCAGTLPGGSISIPGQPGKP
jgi:hypothetical protein